ncbi:hypothetical protein BDQ94DRAFT_139064 [Aspergillus welwitschiae]|uniref:Uncharacterized protein n=1 Tax=Aspergillus welwitschiae TaxID=1341132 RepID=A0A3F3Q8Z1_9EURO|nr:hypothetical protein BDQ94DRAFT_139064 [Aspergillus welwitschiae]RDH35704.1 hypothetical protein BDQ94DRAFT_139064 [Aspergillus welwitschiae]
MPMTYVHTYIHTMNDMMTYQKHPDLHFQPSPPPDGKPRSIGNRSVALPPPQPRSGVTSNVAIKING